MREDLHAHAHRLTGGPEDRWPPTAIMHSHPGGAFPHGHTLALGWPSWGSDQHVADATEEVELAAEEKAAV